MWPVILTLWFVLWNVTKQRVLDVKRMRQAKILVKKPPEDGKEKVLVIEDYTAIWPVYDRALYENYDVHFVASAEEGLVEIEKHPYRVVIADLKLGKEKMDGVEFVKQAKCKYPFIYYIVATGHIEQFPLDKVLYYFNEILVKSFGIDMLRIAVHRGVKQSVRWYKIADGTYEFKN